MIKRLLFLLLTSFALAGSSFGQETLTSDPQAVAPFRGQVSYQITYSGKLSYAQKRWLPDSMLVTVRTPNIRIQLFGGMSDSLLHDICWNSQEEHYLLLDHHNHVAYFPKRPTNPPVPKRTMLEEETQLLGHTCQAWKVNLPGETNQIWLSEDLPFPLPPADSGRVLSPTFFQAGLAAIPLKTIRSYQGVVVTTTATAIVPLETVADDAILPPSNYPTESFEGRMERHPLTRD